MDNIKPFVEIDKDAKIVLPKTAELSEVKASVEQNNTDQDIAGTIHYTYADREVGTADIRTTGVVVQGYAFDNLSTEEMTEAEKDTIEIKPVMIVLLVLAVALLAVLLFLLKRFCDNYYMIRRRRAMRRNAKEKNETAWERRRRKKRARSRFGRR